MTAPQSTAKQLDLLADQPTPATLRAADPTGAALRDASIAAAARHADAVRAQWNADAFAHLCEFADRTPEFTAEDLRAYAAGKGFPAPPDPRAWGGIIRTAASIGMIAAAGYVTSKNPHAHNRPVMLWRSKLAQGAKA